MPCESCKNEQRIIALEKDSERNQITHKEYFSRFEESNINGARSDEKYINLLAMMSEVKKTVDELVAKPAKRWDGLTQTLIACAGTGILTFLITKLLGG